MSRRSRTTAAVRRSVAGFSNINLGESRSARPGFLVLFDVQARGGTTSPSSRLKGRRASRFWILDFRLTGTGVFELVAFVLQSKIQNRKACKLLLVPSGTVDGGRKHW